MQFLFARSGAESPIASGRRPILLLGLAGSVVFYALFGIASDLGASGWAALGLVLIFVARIGAGMAGATISTAQAVIADSTTPEQRSRGMALIGAAFGIGFTCGPLLAAVSLFVPLHGAPGYAAALFSAIASVSLSFCCLRRCAAARRRANATGSTGMVCRPSCTILPLAFSSDVLPCHSGFGGLESTLAFVNQVLLFPQEELTRERAAETVLSVEKLRANSWVFAYVGFVLMLAQAFLIGVWSIAWAK